jgi:uncharacterized protein YacL (UPF0231 family)
LKDRDEVAKRFNEDEQVDKAVKDAVRNAIAEHARKGNEIVIWQDGKPVWVRAPKVEDV